MISNRCWEKTIETYNAAYYSGHLHKRAVTETETCPSFEEAHHYVFAYTEEIVGVCNFLPFSANEQLNSRCNTGLREYQQHEFLTLFRERAKALLLTCHLRRLIPTMFRRICRAAACYDTGPALGPRLGCVRRQVKRRLETQQPVV
jgi:hypothetical protein